MIELLKRLCSEFGTSGDEENIRKIIIDEIKDYCEFKVDPLGNITAFKKGKNRAEKKVLLDAHMDEVGLIITSVTADGYLKFAAVGGIDTAVMLSRQVVINGKVPGVIGMRPVHLQSKEESVKLPKSSSLYIDIGAKDRDEALEFVSEGDRAVISGPFFEVGNKIISKALDDRVGCAVLCDILKSEAEYDFYASFSVQEEVGLRGAKTAAFSIDPDAAIILEGTTAADIAGVEPEKAVCRLGKGVAVSFMDGGCVYDRKYFELSLKSGITAQKKCGVTGGNNAGSVHLTKGGVRTLALSVPCRYIHSASSVCDTEDIKSARLLAEYMLNLIASGKDL